MQKLTQIKKFPIKFNLTELTNNYINTKIFSKIKNSKKSKNKSMNNNNIALINSMNHKNKPLIIDTALINININSNKYIIDNDNNDFHIRQKTESIRHKKVKSKSPTILRFHNYKMNDFPNIRNEEVNENKNNAIISNRLRLKTDYNNFKINVVDYFEPNLKTVNNMIHNKDNFKYKLNNKLKFNKIYSFLHKK